MRRWLMFAVGLLISAIALYFSFRNADFAEIVAALGSVRYGYVGLSVVVAIFSVGLRGLRWSVLTGGRLPPASSFWLWNIGYLYNNILPAKLGEVARAWLAGRRPAMSFSGALSSIVVERLFDIVSVVLTLGVGLLGAGMMGLPLPGWAITAGLVMGAVGLVGIGVLAYAARRPQGALRLGVWGLDLIPGVTAERAQAFLSPFVDGLGGVSDLRIFAAGAGLSLACWLTSAVTMWLTMLAFWPEVPFVIGVLTVGAAGLGVSVPSAPSGVGPYQAAVIAVLTAIGYDLPTSQSFSIVAHALAVLMTSVLGIIGLVVEGVRFDEVARQAQTLKEHAPAGE